MSRLGGARIALLEARLASELADLVRREGGEPVCAPAVTEAPVDVTALIPVIIEDIRRGQSEIVVFLTGAGLNALIEQAEQTGTLSALTDAFTRVTTVCRGPKPAAVLRRIGVPVSVNAAAPHTTAELLAVMPASAVSGKGVVLLHDGGGNPLLVDALRLRGAWVEEVRSYEWRLPDDIAPIERLVEELIDERVDAIAFTSQVQIRHLFEVGARLNRSAALLYALRHRTVVGSIGPTCSNALSELGVPPHVIASPPRMRPLITAIGEYLAARQPHTIIEGTS
ncbi:MAG: uroporphyrinogen-III synthase [Gemmatimonadaceae bacterium]